jgi:hypothetical protein
MTTDPAGLADRLLDAQVEFLLGEVTADRFAEVIARDVDDVLAALDQRTVADIVARDEVKATALLLVDRAGGSPLVERMVGDIGDAVYQLAAADDHHLGEVIDRDQVDALVRKVLSMGSLRDELLERLAESPTVATVASWFVTKLVSDVMQQNRERAEKIPGVSSLLSLGDRAADKVRNATSRHVDQFLGDMAGKGAQVALRRVSVAIQHTASAAPLQDAAMEVWDLHADDKISGLKNYLSQQDLRDLALIIHEIWLILRDTEYFGEVIRAGVDVFFDNYGGLTVSQLLDEVGISRDDLVAEIRRHAPAIVAALNADGQLAKLIRSRLEPFFHSDAVLAMLAGD